MNYYNHYHKQREQGLKVEDEFKDFLKNKGETVISATSHENKMYHYDLKCWNEDIKSYINIDVKDRKAISRAKGPQDKMILLELRNSYGGPGWLYGKSHYIAFNTLNRWILAKTDDLRQFVTPYATTEVQQNRVNKEPYKLYSRNNLDCFIFIPLDNIVQLEGTYFELK